MNTLLCVGRYKIVKNKRMVEKRELRIMSLRQANCVETQPNKGQLTLAPRKKKALTKLACRESQASFSWRNGIDQRAPNTVTMVNDNPINNQLIHKYLFTNKIDTCFVNGSVDTLHGNSPGMYFHAAPAIKSAIKPAPLINSCQP